MWKNHLKVALRTLRHRKGYAALNVVGLAVGLVCCGFIGLYVQDELSYDRFNAHADRIYRVVRDVRAGGEDEHDATTSGPLAPALAAQVPGVARAVRVVRSSGLLEHGEGATRVRAMEDDLAYADAALFDVFTLPLVAGDEHTALTAPNAVVLSETLARTYFGDADPMGQSLLLDGATPLTVTGVMRDVPSATHLPFDAAVSWATWDAVQRASGDDWLLDEWNANYLYTYLLLDPGTSPARVAAALPAFVARTYGDDLRDHFEAYRLGLQPLTAIHLAPPRIGEPTPPTDPARLTLFGVIGAFILLIACVNFVNLATARAAQRAREVGVRKAVGAWRSQLVGQFLTESVLVSAAALVLALGASLLLLPGFDALAGKEIGSLWAHGGRYPLALATLALVVGLAAGSYPALVLSGFRPAAVLRGAFRGSARGVRLRQGLVVVQFSISIALLAGTGVVYSQLRYMRAQSLGFDRDHLLVLDFDGDADVEAHLDAVRQTLAGRPGVLDVAASSSVPGRGHNGLSVEYEAPDGTPQEAVMNEYAVDDRFLDTYRIPLVAGRALTPSDSSTAFLVNEAAVARLGFRTPDEAVGARFGLTDHPGQIVGVVQDFHYHGLRDAVEPLMLHPLRMFFSTFTLRLAPGDVHATLAALERAWADVAPQRPFTYSFLDESFDRQYRADVQFGQLVGVFAGLAILVACLGLFGLAAFTAVQRTKEIGVRKVLGASTPSLVGLLSRDFLALVGVAFLLAAPLAYGAMSRWLEGFAYRITLGPGVFLAAGALTLLVALAAVSTQALRAAAADPVRALRTE